MKKIFIVICSFSLFACHLKQGGEYLSGIATIPSFDIQLLDSTTLIHAEDIPAGKPIVMVYFRPDCPHCQLETRNLIKSISQLKNSRIYFLTAAELRDARGYAHNFRLDQYPDIITIGKDHEHSFAKIFHPSSIPFLALYDSQKKLIRIYHGEVPVTNLLAAIHG